jgi:CRP/FNR family transcriptional regulator
VDTPREDVLAAVRECRLWRGASDEGLARLAASATLATAGRGAILVEEGEAADRFGLVVDGHVRVSHLAPDGRRLTLEDLGAGEVFGAAAALSGGRHPAHAEATTPAAVAWLTRDSLFELVDEEPAVAHRLITDLANRVVDYTEVVQTLGQDVPSRLAGYLFGRSLAAGSATPQGLMVDLGMTKTELASALGTVPETLSRAFARLRDQGLLEVRGREVLIFDVRALAHMSSGYDDA